MITAKARPFLVPGRRRREASWNRLPGREHLGHGEAQGDRRGDPVGHQPLHHVEPGRRGRKLHRDVRRPGVEPPGHVLHGRALTRERGVHLGAHVALGASGGPPGRLEALRGLRDHDPHEALRPSRRGSARRRRRHGWRPATCSRFARIAVAARTGLVVTPTAPFARARSSSAGSPESCHQAVRRLRGEPRQVIPSGSSLVLTPAGRGSSAPCAPRASRTPPPSLRAGTRNETSAGPHLAALDHGDGPAPRDVAGGDRARHRELLVEDLVEGDLHLAPEQAELQEPALPPQRVDRRPARHGRCPRTRPRRPRPRPR